MAIRSSLHRAAIAFIAMAQAVNRAEGKSMQPVHVPNHMLGAYGWTGITGTGKHRKHKSNRIHRSRMLRRKHTKARK